MIVEADTRLNCGFPEAAAPVMQNLTAEQDAFSQERAIDTQIAAVS